MTNEQMSSRTRSSQMGKSRNEAHCEGQPLAGVLWDKLIGEGHATALTGAGLCAKYQHEDRDCYLQMGPGWAKGNPRSRPHGLGLKSMRFGGSTSVQGSQ